jgi:hypothetical protein
MDELAFAVLAQRVEQLERANRRWKRLASVTFTVLGIVVLLGATASKKAKSPAALLAPRIVLVDKAEKGRAELTMMADNEPGLMLVDESGKPRLLLSLTQYGEPMLSLADAGGTRRIVLGLDLYGSLLRFSDEAGRLRAALMVPAEGEPQLELLGKDDQVLWRAP